MSLEITLWISIVIKPNWLLNWMALNTMNHPLWKQIKHATHTLKHRDYMYYDLQTQR